MFQLLAAVAAAVALMRLQARVSALEDLVDLLHYEVRRLESELDDKMPRR